MPHETIRAEASGKDEWVLRFAVSWFLGHSQVELGRGRWLRINAIMVLIRR